MRRKVPEVSVDPCLDDGGLILSIGAVSVWLDERVAVDVMIGIAAALSGDDATQPGPRRAEDPASEGIPFARTRSVAKA